MLLEAMDQPKSLNMPEVFFSSGGRPRGAGECRLTGLTGADASTPELAGGGRDLRVSGSG